MELLLATLTNNQISRICYIKKEADNQRYFYYQTNDKQIETLETYDEGKVPANFPTKTYPTQYMSLRQILNLSF